MTRDEIIAYAEKKYGNPWVAKLARDINYSISNVARFANGEMLTVTRRMELEMKLMIRVDRMRFMKLHAVDVRYDQ